MLVSSTNSATTGKLVEAQQLVSETRHSRGGCLVGTNTKQHFIHVVNELLFDVELIRAMFKATVTIMSSSANHFRFLFVLAILGALANSQSDKPNHRVQSNKEIAMFVFGDSLCDPGNNDYVPSSQARVNFPSYGETFFHYPTGRDSVYAGLPYWRACLDPDNHNFTGGANFASAGACALIETNDNSLIFVSLSKLSRLVFFFLPWDL
ncbi:hypothetical protein SLEP1_g54579 [Rubroshorea leprosula]|uniref:GDSL esterase/lipase n=1 Tax=Rubroshorea leprosula TaxID=152421 RepID=A0AAV5MCX1_9ROSI|nr:hypothetical protein SLEP1_g54579 [Rubroshorea leprosula]